MGRRLRFGALFPLCDTHLYRRESKTGYFSIAAITAHNRMPEQYIGGGYDRPFRFRSLPPTGSSRYLRRCSLPETRYCERSVGIIVPVCIRFPPSASTLRPCRQREHSQFTTFRELRFRTVRGFVSMDLSG